jgi:ribonucleotide monophosphatase NagD (HAD superfamily)
MIVIGDTMETDILGGAQLGFRTVLVLSGGTQAQDVALLSLPTARDRKQHSPTSITTA